LKERCVEGELKEGTNKGREGVGMGGRKGAWPGRR
jgi:hypothetical protein